MHFSYLASLFSLAVAVKAVTVSYNTGYDQSGRSLDALACSNGEHGLETLYGWTTQAQVAGFPNIGGVEAVATWDSPSCGTCWKLEYNGRSVNVLAVDHADAGYNIALAAMNTLTNGQAEQLGRVEATATQVAVGDCGLEAA